MFEQIILILVALVSLTVGLLVIRGSIKNFTLKLAFFLMCLTLIVWSLSLGWFLAAESVQLLDWSSRCFYISSALFCPIMTIFALNFPSGAEVIKQKRAFIWSIATLTLVFSAFIMFTPSFIINKTHYANGSSIDVSRIEINPLNYNLFSIFFLFFFITAISIVVSKIRITKGRDRSQVIAFLIGMLVSSAPGFVANLIMPSSGNYSLVWVGPLAITFFLGVIAYSIIKFGMFDVRATAVRATTYILLLGSLTAIYFGVAYIFSAIIFPDQNYLGISLGPANVALALLLAFLFQPIKHFFDKMTDRIFYHGQYDQAGFLKGFGKIVSYDTDLRLLLKQASKYIAENLGAEFVVFSIEGRGMFGNRTRSVKLIDTDIDDINNYYRKKYEFPSVMVESFTKSEEISKLMRLYKIDMILPLIIQGQVIGNLYIGEHKGGGYTTRDGKIIESIANELTIAVQNSLSVEEIREFNETLQHKVSEATRELRTTNQQLQRLDEAKNEFISMASHQLRTPLTSIKGYLDMVLQGDLGKISATQKAVLSEAFVSSERMVTLINDFLNVSRLQTGKFAIDRVEGDLKEVIKEQLGMLSVVAKQHDLTIKDSIDPKVPLMNIDIDKLRQVTLNFIDNAIYYSKPNTIIHVKLAKEGNDIVFTVKDTGIGVPEDEQARLFGRFFRATNAKKRRPDGTGVGLFLAKKIVTLHGGKVIFNSKENKGSTFGFQIPIQ